MLRWTAASALFLAACTVTSGKVPVIDELSLPAEATLHADGTYHVDGTISYHDDDDVVTRFRVQVLNTAAQIPAGGSKRAVREPLSLRIAGTAPKGATTITVIALDREANASEAKTATVTLK